MYWAAQWTISKECSELNFMEQTKSVIEQAMNGFMALHKPVIIIMKATYTY